MWCFLILFLLNGCNEVSSGRITSSNNSNVNSAHVMVSNKGENNSAVLDSDGLGSGQIIPGKGTEKFWLGNSREHLIKVLGKPNEEYHYGEVSDCNHSDMHWLELGTDGDGIFCYLKDGAVFQISFSLNRYVLPNGITIGTPINDVLGKYVSLQGFELLHSAGEVNGGKNLLYLVEQNQGIAFEMYYDKKERKRKVWSAIVFEPHVSFLPNGCLSRPQEFVRTSNYK